MKHQLNFIFFFPYLCLFVAFLFIFIFIINGSPWLKLFIVSIILFIFWIMRGLSSQTFDKYNNIEKEQKIVSPANGKIIDIIKTPNNIHIKIYLNIFNNHGQYAPISSNVKSIKYTSGKNNLAHDLNMSNYNEQNEFIFESKNYGKIIIRQYGGKIMRTLKSFVNEGDFVEMGQPIGFIATGSRVDIIFPNIYGKVLKIKKGDTIHIGDIIMDNAYDYYQSKS